MPRTGGAFEGPNSGRTGGQEAIKALIAPMPTNTQVDEDDPTTCLKLVVDKVVSHARSARQSMRQLPLRRRWPTSIWVRPIPRSGWPVVNCQVQLSVR